MKRIFLFLITICYVSSLTAEKQKPYFVSDEDDFYANAKSGLILRDSPSLNSKKLNIIPFNEKVHSLLIQYPGEIISDIYGYWRKVKYKNETGWVFGGFLTQTLPLQREQFEKGEKCSSNEAVAELIDGKTMKVHLFEDGPNITIPCILNYNPRFISEGVLVREFYISNSSHWLIVLTGTDIVGTLYIIDLASNSSKTKSYLDFKIIDPESFTFLERIDCHTGIWITFQNETFIKGVTERVENCQM